MRIRAELTASHDHVWQQLAAPGTWLTGSERVAVARELRAARDCPFCQERKTSLSPGAIKGHHETVDHDIPTARVELIHKLVTDPGRITRSWVRELLAGGRSSPGPLELLVDRLAVEQSSEQSSSVDRPARRDAFEAEGQSSWTSTNTSSGAAFARLSSTGLLLASSLMP